MQVHATENTQEYANTSKKEKVENSSVKFDMSKPFDINNFTFEDYKNIDGKVFGDWLKESNLPAEEESYISGLYMLAHHSDNDVLNEVLFDRVASGETSYDETIKTVFMGLSEMEFTLDYEAIVRAGDNNDSNAIITIPNERTTMHKHMVNGELRFKGEDILNNMKYFSQYYDELSENQKSMFYKPSETSQAFDAIVTEYTKRKEEKSNTLDAYTRNTKQNPLEKMNN